MLIHTFAHLSKVVDCNHRRDCILLCNREVLDSDDPCVDRLVQLALILVVRWVREAHFVGVCHTNHRAVRSNLLQAYNSVLMGEVGCFDKSLEDNMIDMMANSTYPVAVADKGSGSLDRADSAFDALAESISLGLAEGRICMGPVASAKDLLLQIRFFGQSNCDIV